jgi:hypothetical protein
MLTTFATGLAGLFAVVLEIARATAVLAAFVSHKPAPQWYVDTNKTISLADRSARVDKKTDCLTGTGVWRTQRDSRLLP